MLRVDDKNLWVYPTRDDAIIVVSYKRDVMFGVLTPSGDWSVIPLEDAFGVSRTTTRHINTIRRLAQGDLNAFCDDVVATWGGAT